MESPGKHDGEEVVKGEVILEPIATDIPVTSLESSTYSLQSTPPTSEDNKDDRQQEEEASVYKEENQNEEEGDDREDEEVELEEEIEREMTYEEKKAIYEAVKNGDIDALEDCLDKPNSDINMIWYKENLLMAAIRHGQKEMAEFLLDNGVDHTYSTSVVELRQTRRGKIFDRYDLTCRQMAYDQGLLDIVELIDILQGNVFSFIRPPARTPRQRRIKPSSSSEGSDDGSNDDENDTSSSGSDSDSDGSLKSSRSSEEKKQKKKKEKKKTKTSSNECESALNENRTGYEAEHENTDDVSNSRKKKMKKRNKNADDNADSDKDEDGSDKTREMQSRNDGRLGSTSFRSEQVRTFALKVHKIASQTETIHATESLCPKETIRSKDGGLFPSQEKDFHRFLNENNKNSAVAVGDSDIPVKGERNVFSRNTVSSISPDVEPRTLPKADYRIRSSKSALANKVNSYKRKSFRDHQADIQNQPLTWRKVAGVGSYTKESRHWHRDTSRGFNSYVQANEIKPATSLSSTSELPVASSLHTEPLLKHITPSTLSTSGLDNSKAYFPNDKRVVATQTDKPVPHYRQPALCKVTKRKLSPRFLNSYTVLDFVPEIGTS